MSRRIFSPTTGAAGAIAHAIRAVTKPGDEVLTFAPYFPRVRPYVEGTGAVLKVVPPQAPAFQPNLDAFEEMLTETSPASSSTPRTTPPASVYSAETLSRLADILTEKSKVFGHNIFLVSDEPYRDIAFDGKKVPYPAAFYPHTLTCFSFSKSLSLPGERLGYVAVRPGCEGEDVLVDMMAQISRFTGHNCPPSIIQKATAECLDVTSDLSVYETNMNLRTISSPSWALRWSARRYIFISSRRRWKRTPTPSASRPGSSICCWSPATPSASRLCPFCLLHRHREGEAQPARTGKAGRSL